MQGRVLQQVCRQEERLRGPAVDRNAGDRTDGDIAANVEEEPLDVLRVAKRHRGVVCQIPRLIRG